MLKKWLHAWQNQPRGTLIERIYFAAGAAILGLDLLLGPFNGGNEGISAFNIATAALSFLALTLTGFFPAAGGTLVITILTVTAMLNGDASVYGIGVYLVAADWAYRGWLSLAIVGPVLVEGCNIIISGDPGYVLAFIIGTSLALPVGMGFRWHSMRAENLRKEIESTRELAKQEAVDGLRAELHDTVARNLAQLTVATQNLLIGQDTEAKAARIENLARESLNLVRSLIKDQDAKTQPQSIGEAIEGCQSILSEKGISLDVLNRESAEQNLTESQMAIITLAIQEGGLNILKYGRKKSAASLRFEIENDSSITMFMISEIAATEEEILFDTGGYGLVNLAARARPSGGDAFGWQDGNKWILTMFLPKAPKATDQIGALDAE